jgi:hypothetical protein
MQITSRLRAVLIALVSMMVATGGLFTAVALAGTSSRGSQPRTVTTNPGAPANQVLPTISGTAYVNGTLIASPGTWTGTPAPSFTYQWFLCVDMSCNEIAKADGITYTPIASQLGDTLLVEVTATNTNGSVSANSAETNPVEPAAPGLVTKPVVYGDPIVGNTLTASEGEFSGANLSYAQVWQRCSSTKASSCKTIPGATTLNYKVTSSDLGDQLRIVTAAYNKTAAAFATSSLSTPVVSYAQLVSALETLIQPSGKNAHIPRLLNNDGYLFAHAVPVSGRLAVSWTAKLGGKRVTIAKLTVTILAHRQSTWLLTLTSAGRSALKHHKRLTITVHGGLNSVEGADVTASQNYELTS